MLVSGLLQEFLFGSQLPGKPGLAETGAQLEFTLTNASTIRYRVYLGF